MKTSLVNVSARNLSSCFMNPGKLKASTPSYQKASPSLTTGSTRNYLLLLITVSCSKLKPKPKRNGTSGRKRDEGDNIAIAFVNGAFAAVALP